MRPSLALIATVLLATTWAPAGAAGTGMAPASGAVRQAGADTDGPELTIARPAEGAKYTGALTIDVHAADPAGVGRISLFADGKAIRSFTTGETDPAKFPKELPGRITWQGAKHLSKGAHTIKVLAIDGLHNQTVRTVHVRRVDPGALRQIRTRILPLRISGKGRTRTVRTRVEAVASGTAPAFGGVHHLRIYFERRRRGHWVLAHRYTRSAKHPLRLTARLEKARWRVRVTFPRRAPFLGSKSSYRHFTIS